MIGENRFSNPTIRAVVTIALIVGFLAVAFVSVSADDPCIPCLANEASAARYTAPAEYYAAGATAANQAYAARYTLLAEHFAAAATVERGAECNFVDHELMYAGGYSPIPGFMVERGADFDFVDHELMYAGGYTLRPGTMVKVGTDEVTCGG